MASDKNLFELWRENELKQENEPHKCNPGCGVDAPLTITQIKSINDWRNSWERWMIPKGDHYHEGHQDLYAEIIQNLNSQLLEKKLGNLEPHIYKHISPSTPNVLKTELNLFWGATDGILSKLAAHHEKILHIAQKMETLRSGESVIRNLHKAREQTFLKSRKRSMLDARRMLSSRITGPNGSGTAAHSTEPLRETNKKIYQKNENSKKPEYITVKPEPVSPPSVKENSLMHTGSCTHEGKVNSGGQDTITKKPLSSTTFTAGPHLDFCYACSTATPCYCQSMEESFCATSQELYSPPISTPTDGITTYPLRSLPRSYDDSMRYDTMTEQDPWDTGNWSSDPKKWNPGPTERALCSNQEEQFPIDLTESDPGSPEETPYD